MLAVGSDDINTKSNIYIKVIYIANLNNQSISILKYMRET